VLLCSLVVTAAALAVATARAQTLSSTTIPFKDEPPIWLFANDRVVSLSATKKGGQILGHFTAYSLSDLKPVWEADQAIADTDVEEGNDIRPDPERNAWYIGSGPFSHLDLATGKIDWSVPCEQTGAVQGDQMRFLPGGRLLVMGSEKCKVKSQYDALKDPVFTMLDTNTGKVLWRYATHGYEYEMALGYWARVAQYQGKYVPKDKRIQLMSLLGSSVPGGFGADSAAADRLLIAGERLEGVKLSDGTPVFKTKDEVGILRGAYNGKMFFRKGDDVTAFDAATGAVAWKYDLKAKNVSIYTIDDLRDMKHGVPDDMHDIFISEASIVSLVSVESGKALWTLKRSGMAWQGSVHGFLTKGDDKVTAYDWKTATKLWEAKIGSRPKGYDSGDYIVFVDGGPIENDRPTPPYRITAARGSTGEIVWTKKDVGGKKIDSYGFDVAGQVRLQSGDAVENVNVADGSVAPTPPREGADGGYITTFSSNGVRCRDWTGKLVWERKGSKFLPPVNQPYRHGLVVWTTSDGDVEVIGLADGSTKWKAKVAKEPYVRVNLLGTHMVVPDKKGTMLVKLVP
jgi:outer membrane protein assembly factor BamB